MLQRLREWLVLVLIVVLPFHALLVTVGTRLLVGAGQAPLPLLAGWKEILLGVVLTVVFVEIVQSFRCPSFAKAPAGRQLSGVSFQVSAFPFRVDAADVCIILLLMLGTVLPGSWKLEAGSFLYGFKYTLFPLFLFLILRRVSWSERFLLLTAYFLLLVGAVVAGYGILTLFLPESFFTWLGYSDLHSLYLPDGPIAAFQKIEGTGIRRIQSTFSGPNQLGMWLLIPWSVVMSAWHKAPHPNPLPRGDGKMLVFLIGAALFFTFSRAAWIGAAVILLASIWQTFPRKSFRAFSFQVSAFSFVFFVLLSLLVPGALLRVRSSRDHIRRPLEAIETILAHPLGLGLGSAGPASNRTSDPCVYLEKGADASWASDRPALCIFVGDQQVQPVGRVCRCPLLPENWYLQVGVELGVAGLILYLLLVGVIGYSLFVTGSFSPISLAFIGVSIAAVFLHAWEDSAVAYTVWMLVASVLPVHGKRM